MAASTAHIDDRPAERVAVLVNLFGRHVVVDDKVLAPQRALKPRLWIVMRQ
jgi:hypothetical protein